MNYKVLGMLMAICVCLVAVEAVVAVDSGSYVLVSSGDIGTNETIGTNDTFNTPTSLTSSKINMTIKEPAYNNTRLSQGQCVEIGGVYDVSGVIGFSTTLPYNAFAYYGRYETGFDPFNEWYNLTNTYVYQLPDRRSAYYNFLVDETIFGERQGYWYQFNGEFERGGNKRAFYVSDRCIQTVNETVTATIENHNVLITPKLIENRRVGDILVSNDDPLYLNETGYYQTWVFGNTKWERGHKLYLAPQYPVLDFNITKTLYEGSYSLVLQNHGDDGIYGVDYQKSDRNVSLQEFLVPSLRSIAIQEITGMQPTIILPILKTILDQTDDFYRVMTMEIQPPHVEIAGYQEIRYDNASLLEVVGYTNKMPGTPITVYVDRDSQTGESLLYPSMTTITEPGNIGDYRTFHGYFPLFYNTLAPGFHTLTAVLPSGKSSTVSFYIREELAPHHVDPQYFKFVDGDPFYVPPPPVIVEKEVIKEVEKIVIQTETVYIPVDYNTLAQETLNKALSIIAAVVIIGLPALYGCILAIRVYAERRLKKLSDKGVEK